MSLSVPFVSRARSLCVCTLVLVFALSASRGRAADAPTASIYDFFLVQMDGSEVHLSAYKGKVVVFVNLARNSSFADQIPALEKLSRTYQDRGLVVIGVPADDFGAEEPGTDAEVKKAYLELHLSFPVVARVSVRGKDQVPLYGFLTGGKDKSLSGDVHWNFTKFIVDRNGQVVERFSPDVDPASPQLKMTVEKVLAGTFKKVEKGKEETPGSEEGDDDDDE